jgi:hypothetical protein
MTDPRLIDYVRKNLHLGYTEEQLRKVLISAGYNVRDIDDAIDSVLRPASLTPQAPPEKPKQESTGVFSRVPIWMIASGIGGVFLLVIIIVLIIPSGEPATGLIDQEGIKVSAYDFSCAGPASSLSITIKNNGESDLSDVQLFVEEEFQQGQIISSLNTGASDTFSYTEIDCTNWRGEKSIKIVSDKVTIEGPIDFKCSSGACSG